MNDEMKLLEYGNPYWKNDPELFSQLYWLVKNHPRNHIQSLTKKPKLKPGCKNLKYPDTWELFQWVNTVTPKLQDPIYTVKTKVYWILHGLVDFPVCANETHGKHTLEGKNVITSTLGYGHHTEQSETYCCTKCKYEDEKFVNAIIEKLKANFSDEDWYEKWYDKQLNTRLEKFGGWIDYENMILPTVLEKYGVTTVLADPVTREKGLKTIQEMYGKQYMNVFQVPEIKEKSAQTLLERTGFRNCMQNPETKKKVKETVLNTYGTYSISHKYEFDNKSFDSSWELCFYEYSIDAGSNVIYPSGLAFPYYDVYGNEKTYYPDFIVDGQVIEIKGKQFFKEDGSMICPFRCNYISEQEYLDACQTYELKHQCMIRNNVRILSENELIPIFKYIKQKHNVKHYMDYCKQFRKVNSKHEERSEKTEGHAEAAVSDGDLA